MRFNKLKLSKYGSFDGCEMIFPQATRDFHFIAGRNEAGKSTAMAGVSDLLFGFPHAKSQDYKFDASLLRVGASLSHNGETLDCQRKRGKVGTLLDPSNQSVSEDRIIRMLQGSTRDSFRLGWSLSHQQLRDGGRSIAESRDDVGQAIFAAGSGLVGIAETVDALCSEAEQIWKKGATARRWNIAHRELVSAIQSVKENSIRPKDWQDALERKESLELRRDELTTKRARLRVEEKKHQRRRRLAANIRRFEELRTYLFNSTTKVLSLSDEREFYAAMEAIATAHRAWDAAQARLHDLDVQLNALSRDAEIVELSNDISELLEKRGAVKQAFDDLPRRRTNLAAKQLQIDNILADLNLVADAKIGELRKRLPSRQTVSTIRDRARKLDRLREAKRSADDRVVELKEESEAILSQGAETDEPLSLPSLRAAVGIARKQGKIDQELRSAEISKKDADKRLAVLITKLAPWSGGIEDLLIVDVMADSVLESWRLQLEDGQRNVAEEKAAARKLADEHEQKRISRASLVASERAVTAEEVRVARKMRADSWQPLRDHLFAQEALTDPKSSVSQYEDSVLSADGLSDDRFLSAKSSAALEVLDAEITLLDLKIKQTDERLEEAERLVAELLVAWGKELSMRALPSLDPLNLRDWIKKLQAAVDQHATVLANSENVTRLTDEKAHALTSLRKVSQETISLEIQMFAEALEIAEARLEELEGQSRRFEQSEKEKRDLAVTTKLAVQKAALAGKIFTESFAEFTASTSEAAFPDDIDEATLDLYEELRSELDAALDLEHRIKSMDADCTQFTVKVSELGARLAVSNSDPMDCLLILDRRLAAARITETRAEHFNEQIAQLKDEVEIEAGHKEAAVASLLPIKKLLLEQDTESLKNLVEESTSIRELQVEKEELTAQIVLNGDGLPLETLLAEVEGAASDEDAALEEGIAQQIADLDTQLTEAATDLGIAKESFRAIDKGDEAVKAAADVEIARANLALESEEFVSKKAQVVLLEWLLERQREADKSPLLSRASDIFRHLTLSRYDKLEVDSDGSTPRLLGVLADGASTVPLDAMSDGTKDQLYLSLRVAVIEQSVRNGVTLPFLADDLFINYDDDRARAGLEVLGELSKVTQVFFFTHHDHLLEIAKDVFGIADMHHCQI
jgi:uncharacterized protein YhaN